jgi:DNA-binding response OmpR family regulator
MELMANANNERVNADVLEELKVKGLLAREEEDPATRPVVGEVWRSFIKRQALTHAGGERGIRVDVDAGEVFTDGRRVEQLTELEYKLVLLLYGRLNKVVDKYAIVTQVWGESYLDQVDDARIEKLVSRLRAKLEPNTLEPKYLITLRGRGYKLVG